jgi:hypothetical protein
LTSCKIHREELNMRIIFIGHFKITYWNLHGNRISYSK